MTDVDIILRTIETLITDFMHKYDERPKYVKIPLWALRDLKDYARELLTNFNFKDLEEKEDFTIFGLKVCETITIKSVNEIEVF